MDLFLAPMAGITDFPFRLLCFEQGCDYATTEMISAQGLLTAPPERNAYRFLMARAPFEGPLIAQIFGADPYFMAKAAQKLTATGRYVGIDINMGCPAQKIVSGNAGSALMRDEALAGRIIASVVRATDLPVSVKMRLGWDQEHKNAVSIARIAQDAGAAMITVHGRTRTQQYSGHADWEEIALVKRAVTIPVIANGDVTDGASAQAILIKTGCDGIAIGRAALGNPWIFADVRAALLGKEYTPPDVHQIVQTARRHARMMIAWKGEKPALLEMRKYFAWYVHSLRGAAQVRTRLNTALTFDEVYAILDDYEQQNRADA